MARKPTQDEEAKGHGAAQGDSGGGKPEPKDGGGTTSKPETGSGATAHADELCCCEITVWCEYIKVEKLTYGGSIPVLKNIFGLANDKILVQMTDCNGKVSQYPASGDGIECDKGEQTGGFQIATVKADKANNCKIDCVVDVFVKKEPLLNEILAQISKIRASIMSVSADIASVTSDLAKNSNALAALKASGPVGMGIAAIAPAVQAITAAIQADQARLTQLNKDLNSLHDELNALIALLVGSNNVTMGYFQILLKGDSLCNDKDWLKHVVKEPAGWKADTNNPDRAELEMDLVHIGGEWKMKLAVFRTCPQH